MSKNQKQLILLVVLLVIAGVAYMYSRNDVPGFQGVSQADTSHFTPLDVQSPDLRLDQLRAIQHEEYSGSNRDIFSSSSPPPSPNGPNKGLGLNTSHPVSRIPGDPYPQLPPPPAPPPPVQVPGQFFGFASRHSGRKVAFFLRDDEVTVVAEGDAFFSNYRLIHIGNDSAEVEEISSGRHTTVPLEQNPDLAANQQVNQQ